VDIWNKGVTPSVDFDVDDAYRRIFAYRRGVEGSGRLSILGEYKTTSQLRGWWTHYLNTWRNFSFTVGGVIHEMAANPDGSILVAVGLGMSNKLQYSTDAINFSIANVHTGTSHYVSCCWADGLFWGVTNDSTPKVGQSSNGSTWTASPVQPFSGAALGGLIRAGKVGGADAVMVVASLTSYISTDGGASWTSGTLAHGANDLCCNDDGVWMAISAGLAVSISTNGVTWTQVKAASITGNVTAVDGARTLANDGGGAWVCAGNIASGSAPGPFVAYSTDQGVTWTTIRLDEDPSWASVCWHPVEQRFYVCCKTSVASRSHVLFRTPSYGTGGGITPT
jgi:hypothetical protein